MHFSCVGMKNGRFFSALHARKKMGFNTIFSAWELVEHYKAEILTGTFQHNKEFFAGHGKSLDDCANNGFGFFYVFI